eukprot:TRINITY_DN9407_c0_g2_i1.p1 TRINITY_DN9407_c0_g2~~TRINITY_DN9407_c0_g2_i1.p1  ORF type:complete len:452 (-),score=83.79 TRINITY_DN9407_c0_g2_i1:748-2103(-)
MEITSQSFHNHLPSIISAIRACDYYAIDTEYSGFSIAQKDKCSLYDDVETRYQKIKFLCQNHLAWQIGLALFKYDAGTGIYECRAYSFPVFPGNEAKANKSFIVTSNALKFLEKYHFSFLKTITEGIGFQQIAREKEVLDNIDDFLLKKEMPISMVNPGRECRSEISKIQEAINDWLLKSEDSITIEFSSKFAKTYFFESDFFKHLNTTPQSKGLSTTLTKTHNAANISEPQKVMHKPSREQLYKKQMGISLLISELIQCKKPLIGHNFMYDLGFFYYQFVDDFSESYGEFKKKLHEYFPVVYDTKIIASFHRDMFPCTDLITIIKRLPKLNKDLVKFTFPNGFANLEESDAVHDAGFDAYCTGKAFAIMAKLIEIEETKAPLNVPKTKKEKSKGTHNKAFKYKEGTNINPSENSIKELKKKAKKERRQERKIMNGTDSKSGPDYTNEPNK